MKYLILSSLLFGFLSLQGQNNQMEKILDQCMIFKIEGDITSLKKASFGMPFAAVRADAGPQEVKHYYFKIAKAVPDVKTDNVSILKIKSVRTYDDMFAELEPDELSFFVASFDPKKEYTEPFKFPIDLDYLFASFPIDDQAKLEDTYFFVSEKIILPGVFNSLTRRNCPELLPGYYKLEETLFKYDF